MKRKMGSDEWKAEVAQLIVALQERSGTTHMYQGIRDRDEHGNVLRQEKNAA